MTAKEREAKQVQQSLKAAIDELLSLPTESQMGILAVIGLDHLRKAASDSMLNHFTHSDETLDKYINNILRCLEHIAHIVREYELSLSTRIDLTKKIRRHSIN